VPEATDTPPPVVTSEVIPTVVHRTPTPGVGALPHAGSGPHGGGVNGSMIGLAALALAAAGLAFWRARLQT
jgi:hypothetical protein